MEGWVRDNFVFGLSAIYAQFAVHCRVLRVHGQDTHRLSGGVPWSPEGILVLFDNLKKRRLIPESAALVHATRCINFDAVDLLVVDGSFEPLHAGACYPRFVLCVGTLGESGTNGYAFKKDSYRAEA